MGYILNNEWPGSASGYISYTSGSNDDKCPSSLEWIADCVPCILVGSCAYKLGRVRSPFLHVEEEHIAVRGMIRHRVLAALPRSATFDELPVLLAHAPMHSS